MKLENVKLNVETKIVLNIGDPMGKTNAPRAYNKLFSELDMNAIMLPLEVPQGSLKEFMKACKVMNIRYFSPTMPHKKDIIPFLDEVDESSRLFQSVNAVKIDEHGVSHGIGMDGKGAVGALLSGGISLAGKRAVMLGSGSISGVIGLELSRKGVRQLTILNRTLKKAEEIVKILSENTQMEVSAKEAIPEEIDQAAQSADVFLQLTPLGMAGYGKAHEYIGFIDLLPSDCTVFDVIINPVDTEIIKAAKKRDLKTVPGMRMLAGQMKEIFKFMFDVELTQENQEACLKELCTYLGVELP